jgi:hypothetical protein
VFQILSGEVADYVEKHRSVTVLRNDKNADTLGLAAMNIGVAKGSTFERVLILPTKPMLTFLRDRNPTQRRSPERLYVAVTRARFSVAFVLPTTGGRSMVGPVVADTR